MAYSRNNPRPVRNLHQQKVQESYKKLEQQKLLEEHQRLEEIRKQNQFMKNQSILFEKAVAFAASSAAAGAGGSGNRRTKPVDAAGQSLLYFNFTDGVFSYFINNFETRVLTDIKTIQMQNDPSIKPITRGGFFLQSYNSDNSNYDLFFINLSGNVIWQDTTENDSDVDIENFSRYVAAYYLKGDSWKLVTFDENSNIKSFSFENRIEGGGYSYDDVWNGGFVVREEVSNIYKFYIINMSDGTSTLFNEYDYFESNLNVYQYAYSNRVVTVKDYTLIEVFNPSGQKLSEFNSLTEFDTNNWSLYQFSFLENNSFVIFGWDSDNSKYTVIFYSGSSDSFSYKVTELNNYDYDIYNQKNYRYPSDWIAEGSAIFLFYGDSEEPNDIRYYEDAKLLPIWSTDSQLRDFYDLGANKGINENLDDANVAFSRSADYINLLIDNDRENDTNYSILRFNREGDATTLIPTNILKSLDLDDDDPINGKTILQFERGLTVSGTWGWSDLSNVEDRFYYSLRESANGDFRNLVNYPIDIVMKDVVSDQYWAIRFTNWQNGGGGGFAYIRQLIEGGTFSGEPIAFTFSNWIFSEPDVIVPGVLELKRNEYGPIYNSAVEENSNGNNPAGTLWNSEYVYNLNSSYEFKWYYVDGSASNPTNSTDFNALFIGTASGNGITYNDSIDWTDSYNKPGYLPSENFAWQVDCLLKVDVAGSYIFNTSSDDGNQLSINGNVVTEFYGARGMEGNSDTSEPINLSVGLHAFRYRLQQGAGGSGAKVQWQGPLDGTFSVIPSSNLVINEAIREYDHYVVTTNGQIVGSVSTSNSYNNDYEGKTYILEDNVFGKTWFSNTQNNEQWQLLSEYYTDTEDNNDISNESGLRIGNYIVSSGFRSRIITENSLSPVIDVPKTGEYLNKIENRDIFHNGAWVITYDENNVNIYFYNMSGELVAQKTVLGTEWSDYSHYNYGERCSIVYSNRYVIIFDGTTIKEKEFDVNYIDVYVNDYNWWDD
jgi:hypothetical protein